MPRLGSPSWSAGRDRENRSRSPSMAKKRWWLSIPSVSRFAPSRLAKNETLADFVERSKKYRGAIDSLKIDRRWNTETCDKRREIFDGSFIDEDKV
jgi:hypothetical protein